MGIDPKLIDQLLAGYKKPEDIAGENGLLKQLTKAVLIVAVSSTLFGLIQCLSNTAGRGRRGAGSGFALR